MKTTSLKKKHQRALFLLDMYERAANIVKHTEKKIEIEDSKGYIDSYLMVPKKHYVYQVERYTKLMDFCEKRYYETI